MNVYQFYNPNPSGKAVGDCTIRALTKALDMTWDEVYALLAMKGYKCCDMPSSNAVWGECLTEHGFERFFADMETFENFCEKHQNGKYLLCTGSHVASCIDGILFDSWDSSNETVDFYYQEV